ncbi:Pleckstrin-like proteiny domain [Sesbania bispinosa]|nr:Pleckstrin-like proteiny domain [Sesbania bispinosa]
MEASNIGGGSERAEEKGIFEYFGWVYHLGVNSIGHEYCHLRFLLLKRRCIAMYKRDPHQNPGIKPLGRESLGPTLMVEELGLRKVNNGDLYVLRIYNRLNEARKREIACATAEEAQRWMEAFKIMPSNSLVIVERLLIGKGAEFELSRSFSARDKLYMETEYALSSPPDRHLANI